MFSKSFENFFSEEETVRENTEECRLREKIRSLEIEMKELIELHSLEFQVIKEQLKEEEQQRKSRQKNHVTIETKCIRIGSRDSGLLFE